MSRNPRTEIYSEKKTSVSLIFMRTKLDEYNLKEVLTRL